MTEKNQQLNPIQVKVILVGDSGVGKTSIISRYIDKYSTNVASTLTTSYFSKSEKIYDYNINFQIWDTVGQEQFRSLNTLFIKDAQICLMVYDITKKSSFFSIKDYWYETILSNSVDNIIFGVAGNKNDLYLDEKVNKEEVQKFTDEINAIFKLTSAKDNVCIDEFFQSLGKKYIKSYFKKGIGPEFCKNEYKFNSFSLNSSINNKKKRVDKCC